MKTALIAALAIAAFAGGVAAAGDMKTEKPELKGFTRTGETTNCLYTRQIDSMKILNKQQILVEMTNGRYYVNEPQNCHLRKQYALVYDSTLGQVCNTTIVTMLDTSSHMQLGSCGFSKFEKIEKTVAAK